MQRRDVLGFVAIAAIWGTSFPATRAGVEVVPPVLFAALRFDGTALLVLGYAVVVAGRWRPRGDDWHAVVAGGVGIVAAHHALLFAGQSYVTSAVAAVVVATVPVFTTVLARTVLPEEGLDATGVLGLLLGLFGVVLVAVPADDLAGGAMALWGDASLVGVALVFASALAWAVGTVAVRRVRTDLPVAAMQGWAMVVGAPVLHLTSLAVGEPQAVDPTRTAVVAYLYLVPVAGGLGYLLYFQLLDSLGAIEITLVSYAIPVFAALVGWYWLGESVTVETVTGFLVICAGFALVKRRALRDAVTRS
ncbi:DMT family transporter [Haloarchaeobius sp. HRN-SO-5]|uniref:DMT family transporter n=1 Tax=Haloarchaeobius sp. HRN-SO-5 TaxID=3446118 RepID=UPI003EBF728C